LGAVRFARDQVQAPLRIRQAEQQLTFFDQGSIVGRDFFYAAGLEGGEHDGVQRRRRRTHHDVVTEHLPPDSGSPDIAFNHPQPARH